MAAMRTTAFCPYCNQWRPFTKPTPNHILHLILTLATCSLWALIWALVAVVNAFEPFTCDFCGSRKLR